MVRIEIGEFSVFMTGTDPVPVHCVGPALKRGDRSGAVDGRRWRSIPSPLRRAWGAPGSIKRSMSAAEAVAVALASGLLKAESAFAVEAALIRCPVLSLMVECLALIDAGLGDMVPSQVQMVEDVRADVARYGS